MPSTTWQRRRAQGLAALIPRFAAERFLSDYGNNAKLFCRLNQVMRRLRLLPLPASFASLLPEASRQVRRRKAELLSRRQTTGAADGG